VIALSKIACGKYTFFEINFSIGSKLSRRSTTAAKDQKKTFLLDCLYLLKTTTNSSNVHVDCKTVAFL